MNIHSSLFFSCICHYKTKLFRLASCNPVCILLGKNKVYLEGTAKLCQQSQALLAPLHGIQIQIPDPDLS